MSTSDGGTTAHQTTCAGGRPHDPVDGVTQGMHGGTDQVEVGPGHGLHGVAVVEVVTGAEQLIGDY
jgi:hypothetical protein